MFQMHTVYTRHDSRTLHKSASTVTGSMREKKRWTAGQTSADAVYNAAACTRAFSVSAAMKPSVIWRDPLKHSAAQHPCKHSDTSLQLLHNTRWCSDLKCVCVLRCTGSGYTYMRSDGICSRLFFMLEGGDSHLLVFWRRHSPCSRLKRGKI